MSEELRDLKLRVQNLSLTEKQAAWKKWLKDRLRKGRVIKPDEMRGKMEQAAEEFEKRGRPMKGAVDD